MYHNCLKQVWDAAVIPCFETIQLIKTVKSGGWLLKLKTFLLIKRILCKGLLNTEFPLCFSWMKSHLSKGTIYIVLQLFQNTWIVLEQICVFKTSIVAELTVCQDIQHQPTLTPASQAFRTFPNLPPPPTCPGPREYSSWAWSQGFDFLLIKILPWAKRW